MYRKSWVRKPSSRASKLVTNRWRLRDYAFPKIGRMPVDSIDQPEVLMCLSPICTEKHETAKRLSQRIKTVLDVAKSKGHRSGENPVTAIRDARVLRTVKKQVAHQDAMPCKDVGALVSLELRQLFGLCHAPTSTDQSYVRSSHLNRKHPLDAVSRRCLPDNRGHVPCAADFSSKPERGQPFQRSV